MRSPKDFWRSMKRGLRYGLLMQGVLWRLAKLGIRIQPFYLIQEGLFDDAPPDLDNGLQQYEVELLNRDDMREIGGVDGRKVTTQELLERLDSGHLCYGIRLNGKIAGFTWCNLKEMDFGAYRISLRENEAYLYDMVTVREFRGRNLAPLLRYQCYKKMYAMGRERLLSFSEYFNGPAIRFKQKLNARFLQVGTSFDFWGKAKWAWMLKTLKPKERAESKARPATPEAL